MRKLTIYALILAIALCAVHPVALADGSDWPDPGALPDAAASGNGAEANPPSDGWLTTDMSPASDQPEPDKEPEPSGDGWINPGDTSTQSESEETSGWLSPSSAPASEEASAPEGSSEGWLSPSSAPVEEETPKPEEDGEDWMSPSSAPVDEETQEPEEDGDDWLTTDDTAAVEEMPEPEEDSEEEDWLTTGDAAASEDMPGEPEEDGEDWLTPDIMPAMISEPEESFPATLADDTEINVTVPGNAKMLINPHRMAIRVATGVETDEQIYNAGQVMVNNGSVPVTVKARVTVDTSESGGVTVSEEPVEATEKQKKAFFYVEFKKLASQTSKPKWIGEYTESKYQVLAVDSDGDAVEKKIFQLDANACAAYRLFGSLSENPTKPWRQGDKLTVMVGFTFTAITG